MLVVEKLSTLRPERLAALLSRSQLDLGPTLLATQDIFKRLLADPLAELNREYGSLKANLSPEDLLVGPEETAKAVAAMDPGFLEALKVAQTNIRQFHEAQLERSFWLSETRPGLLAGRVTRPLAKVGVYIPGGRAPYPSSALMNIIPARVAGVKEIVAITPPGPGFLARPEIVAAASLAGATKIYKLGGAWAIGSLAHGLLGLPKVDKIVGPGSIWVAAAKLAVYGLVDIDSPAGPSEGFIIVEPNMGLSPEILAWDFLAQLEHDPQASAILVTTSLTLAESIKEAVLAEINHLDRAEIIQESLKNAAILVADSLEAAFELANSYAPEHLQLIVQEPFFALSQIQNAGSVFLGPHAPIAGGDYATGPNHVLPTGGAARSFSGLSVDDFLRKMTFQQLSPQALKDLAPTIATLARAEGLICHAKSVETRVKNF
ncbi:MAG: histidinol dehydrogenase [Deltaproteobacteria bacterium]|jgi:histidinol dehydrogenase|nr:histidinol dehydrogenase [Deltaproteobacteria bacterium]